jgi:hypothetical protein
MKIGFLRQEPGTKHAPYDLWTIAAEGSRQVKLARNVSLAAWSSDAAMIAFIRGGRAAFVLSMYLPDGRQAHDPSEPPSPPAHAHAREGYPPPSEQVVAMWPVTAESRCA